MSSDFDEGTFTKARSWLLSFASLLLALAFFGADVQNLSVLGAKIEFTKNKNHVWGVAGLALFYFFVRYCQLLPTDLPGVRKQFKDLRDRLLIRIMITSRRSAIRMRALESLSKQAEAPGARSEISIEGARIDQETASVPRQPWRMTFEEHVVLNVRGVVRQADGSLETTPFAMPIREVPNRMHKDLSKAGALLALCFQTSAFTEYLLPFLWAGVAFVVAINQWLRVAN